MKSIDGYLVPHSIEAEQSVLGALLIDNNAIDRIELESSAFFRREHQYIYKAILDQASIGKSFDVITIAEALETEKKLDEIGGLAYIGSLAHNVPSSANIRHYAEIVRNHHIRREIMAAAAELGEMAINNSIHEAMDRAQSRLLAITEGAGSDEPKSIGEILGEHINTLEMRLSDDRKAISTGLQDLDSILNGGWLRGQVIVLAARPSMGKTALALHHGFSAALAGYGVLCASMEMTSAELADRALSAHGRIRLGNILSGKMEEHEWGGLTHATSKLQSLPIHIIDKPGLTFYQLATYARRHKRKNGLDLFIVDYLQLMSGSDDEKRHAQIEAITRNVKTLAKELNIAVILLSQLSRKTEESRRPKLSHLRDSGSIEQDADVVLFVHREEVDNPDTQWKNYADLYVAKNRQGALGRIGLTYIGHQVRFESYSDSLPDWDEKQNKQRGFK